VVFNFFFFLFVTFLFFLFELSRIMNCFSESASVDLSEFHWQPPRMLRLQVGHIWSHFSCCNLVLWRCFLFRTNKQKEPKKLCAFCSFLKIQLQGFSRKFIVHVLSLKDFCHLFPEMISFNM